MYLLRCTSGVETPRPCVLLYFVLSALTTSKRLQVWQSFALFLCAVVVVVVAIAAHEDFCFFFRPSTKTGDGRGGGCTLNT